MVATHVESTGAGVSVAHQRRNVFRLHVATDNAAARRVRPFGLRVVGSVCAAGGILPPKREVQMGSLVLRRVALGSLVLACGGAMGPTADTGAGSASLVALPPMRVARFAHTATSLPDGRVLVAGGSGSNASATAEIFDPETRRFTPTPGLIRPRGGHTATSLPTVECSSRAATTERGSPARRSTTRSRERSRAGLTSPSHAAITSP